MNKRILNCLAIIVFVISMSIFFSLPGFTDNLIAPGVGETTITYGMSESFIVYIPSRVSIDFDTSEGDMLVSASNVMIGSGRRLLVSISSSQYDGRWELRTAKIPYQSLTYRIGTYEGGSNVSNNSIVLSVNAGECYNTAKATRLYLHVSEEIRYSGTYRDYLTFLVSVY